VLGAGPIGLEAAHRALRAGHDAWIVERGDVADNVLAWGHARMFTPWRMNVSSLGLELLGWPALSAEECPTGREYAERYLLPLARAPVLRGRVHAGERVVSVGPVGDGFRVASVDGEGRAHARVADVVLDCTGTYREHRSLGAAGEEAAAAAVSYELDDVLGFHRDRYARRRTLVVGNGHSAAT